MGGSRSVGTGQGVLGWGIRRHWPVRLAAAITGHGEGLAVESRRFRMDDGCLTLHIRPSGDSCYIDTLGASGTPGLDRFA